MLQKTKNATNNKTKKIFDVLINIVPHKYSNKKASINKIKVKQYIFSPTTLARDSCLMFGGLL
jgi:hypothetical protein